MHWDPVRRPCGGDEQSSEEAAGEGNPFGCVESLTLGNQNPPEGSKGTPSLPAKGPQGQCHQLKLLTDTFHAPWSKSQARGKRFQWMTMLVSLLQLDPCSSAVGLVQKP